MAEYLGRLQDSDPAVWRPFELGLAVMAACQWDPAIEHFREAQTKASGAQLVPLHIQTGVCYYIQGRPDDALTEFKEATRLAKLYGDKQGEAAALGNIGVIRHDSGELGSALRKLREALAITRKYGEQRAAAPYLANIGNIYRDRGESDKALKFHEDALAISREIGDKPGVASCLGNIGSTRCDRDKLGEALQHFEEALAASRETNDRRGLASCLGKIGNVHHYRGELDEALMYYEGALALEREIGYRVGVATELGNIGLILMDKELHAQAVPTLAESLAILLALGVARGPRQALYGLSRCDDQLGRERMPELLKQAGLADAGINDLLDRVDQTRLRRPRPTRVRRAPLVLRRLTAGAR
jgi:tetratricopeptide (TPR) repeat protein